MIHIKTSDLFLICAKVDDLALLLFSLKTLTATALVETKLLINFYARSLAIRYRVSCSYEPFP